MGNTEQLLQKVMETGMDYGLKLLGALAILIVGAFVIRMIVRSVERAIEKKEIDDTLKRFFLSALAILLWVFVILAILAKFGVEIAPIIAGLGLVGFAIGFAVQGSLSNFAAGVMIMILRPFHTGDYVDVAGTAGTVKEIGLLSCILTSPDNKMIVIPNAKIFGEVITNVTAYDTRRVDFSVGIGYGDDIDLAKKVCLDVISSDERVMADPEPMAAVVEMGDSSVNLTVRGWTATSDYWSVFWDCTEKMKKALDEAGVEIPFPQRTVWMRNED